MEKSSALRDWVDQNPLPLMQWPGTVVSYKQSDVTMLKNKFLGEKDGEMDASSLDQARRWHGRLNLSHPVAARALT